MDIAAALKKAYKAFKKFTTTQQQLDAAFIEAVRANKVEKMQQLAADGANPSYSAGWRAENALTIAIEGKNRDMFAAVLAAGSDPNAAMGYSGETPFLFAARKGDAAAVEAMLKKGAKINAAGEGGNTALHHAAAAANRALIKLLLDSGAQADVPSKRGWTPVFHAVRNGDLETIAALLQKGARTDRTDEEGRSLLAIADAYDRPAAKRAIQDHRDSLVPRWQKLEDADEVAHVSIMRDLGYRLTEVFNLRTQRHTVITHNFSTGRDETVVRHLGEADKTAVAEAQKQLAALKTPPQQAAQPG